MNEKELYILNIRNKIRSKTLYFEDLNFSIIDNYEYSLSLLPNCDDNLWRDFKDIEIQ